MSRSQENKIMMLNWNEYRKDLMATIKKIAGISPDVVQGYQTITGAGAKTNKLNEKTRQLISLAVAVTTKCDGCITVHTDLAIKAGATREEIVEALGVAVAMNAGAALVYSARVIDAFEQRSAASA
jgi:AhpD family alkylhydroperoxidase